MSECGHSLFCLADVASEVKCVCSGNQRTKGQANGFIGLIQQRGYHCAEASWNVVAHSQKPDFVFRRNGRVHLNRRGASVQSTTGSRGVRVSGSNAGYTMFRGSVKGIGYPLHSPVSPFTSPPVRHRVPSHFSWNLPEQLRHDWFVFVCEIVWRIAGSSLFIRAEETFRCPNSETLSFHVNNYQSLGVILGTKIWGMKI